VTDRRSNHVFLSYNEENQAFVEALAERLRNDARLSFWFRPWHAIPGEDIQAQMEQALYDSASCAVFVGPGAIEGWQSAQMRAAIQSRVEEDRAYRVIPVLLPGAARPRSRDLPPFLRLYEPVQFGGADDERAFQYLLSGILGIPPIDIPRFLETSVAAEQPPAEAGSFEPLQIDLDCPPIQAIRQLLLAAFTPQSLRRFCQDRPPFRPLLNEFSPQHGLSDMVDEVISATDKGLLWDDLLAEVARAHPRQYARFEPQLRDELAAPQGV
jgi:hypothetical protein